MHIVAIHNIQGDAAQRAKELSVILGVTPYEVRPRINVAMTGIAVVASFASAELAAACIDALQDVGFDIISIDSTQLETDNLRFIVQRLTFSDEQLLLWDVDGQQLDVNYAEIQLLLRGAGIISSVHTETTTKKKIALGRALATGGLVLRKKVSSSVTSVNSERQPFCHIYTANYPAIVLRQDDLDYAALGAERKLSREANFNWICSELRRLCSMARWDDRLQTKPGVAQLLGPVFDPQVDLDLAISVVAKSYV
ncbi:MAG: hypothetical protein RBR22_05470 [Desulfuromonas sp.]|nr:hypothetical protein [Desulfuromonas sp.]